VGLSDREPLLALRGAVGFLSRLPVGHTERAWTAFGAAPWTLPVAGYLLGALVAVPVALALAGPVPAPTVALVYPVALVAVTGINHADGVADLADAAVVHGDADRRHEVLGDATLGVGGTLALALVVAGLALAGLGLASLPIAVAVGLLVASEVGAKLAVATLVALGDPAREGFGAAVAGDHAPRSLAVPAALALPALAFGGVTGGVAALGAAVAVALGLGRWARRHLGGVTGDVFGAANELARVAALHAGFVAWHAGGSRVARLLEGVA